MILGFWFSLLNRVRMRVDFPMYEENFITQVFLVLGTRKVYQYEVFHCH